MKTRRSPVVFRRPKRAQSHSTSSRSATAAGPAATTSPVASDSTRGSPRVKSRYRAILGLMDRHVRPDEKRDLSFDRRGGPALPDRASDSFDVLPVRHIVVVGHTVAARRHDAVGGQSGLRQCEKCAGAAARIESSLQQASRARCAREPGIGVDLPFVPPLGERNRHRAGDRCRGRRGGEQARPTDGGQRVEAVTSNVLGIRNVVDVYLEAYGALRLHLRDKAVCPTSDGRDKARGLARPPARGARAELEFRLGANRRRARKPSLRGAEDPPAHPLERTGDGEAPGASALLHDDPRGRAARAPVGRARASVGEFR
jgi:hypothetical protein